MSPLWIIACIMALVWGRIVGLEGGKRGWPFFPHVAALVLVPITVMDFFLIFIFKG